MKEVWIDIAIFALTAAALVICLIKGWLGLAIVMGWGNGAMFVFAMADSQRYRWRRLGWLR